MTLQRRNLTIKFAEVVLYRSSSSCESPKHTVFPKPFLYTTNVGKWVYWACPHCGPENFCRFCGAHKNDEHTPSCVSLNNPFK